MAKSTNSIFAATDPVRAALSRVLSARPSARAQHRSIKRGTSLGGEPHARVGVANDLVVTIIGCGAAGLVIAGELLRRGCTVRLYDAFQAMHANARGAVIAAMRQNVVEGLLLAEDVTALAARCKSPATMRDALDGASLVVEAVSEDASVKRTLIAEVVATYEGLGVQPEDVLIGSNTLSPVTMLGAAAEGLAPAWAARLIGTRFLYPCAPAP